MSAKGSVTSCQANTGESKVCDHCKLPIMAGDRYVSQSIDTGNFDKMDPDNPVIIHNTWCVSCYEIATGS
jgi:hypothetical protein